MRFEFPLIFFVCLFRFLDLTNLFILFFLFDGFLNIYNKIKLQFVYYCMFQIKDNQKVEFLNIFHITAFYACFYFKILGLNSLNVSRVEQF